MNRPPSWLTAAFLAALAIAVVIGVLIATDVVHPFGDDSSKKPVRTASFLETCVKLTTTGNVDQAEATNYCGCLKASAARGRTNAQAKSLLAEANRSILNGTSVPGALAKAAAPCAKKAGISGG